MDRKQWLIEGAKKEIIEKVLRNEEWQIEDNLVLKGKVYVLRDEKLRLEIIWLYHDIPIAGHGEQWKMVELVTRNYWWPGVTKEVK